MKLQHARDGVSDGSCPPEHAALIHFIKEFLGCSGWNVTVHSGPSREVLRIRRSLPQTVLERVAPVGPESARIIEDGTRETVDAGGLELSEACGWVLAQVSVRLPHGGAARIMLGWEGARRFQAIEPVLARALGTLARLLVPIVENHNRAELGDVAIMALDALDLACFIADRNGFAVLSNLPASRLFPERKQTDLRMDNSDGPLKPLIDAATGQLAKDRNKPVAAPAVCRCTLPNGDVRAAHVFPLGERSRDGLGRKWRDCFAVLIPVHGGVPGALALQAGLGLTQSESRLAAELVGGKSVQEAAGKLSLSEQTARTYLKRIFSKLGISRQSQLVSLAARQFVPIVPACQADKPAPATGRAIKAGSAKPSTPSRAPDRPANRGAMVP